MSEQLTIKDIARLSGVGISTVSRVLNGRPDVGEETRAKVLAVVEREGYVPNGNAKHLKQKSTNYIAVIIRGMQNSFLASVVEKLQHQIEANSFSFLLNYIEEHDDEITAAERIYTEKKVRGFIFLGGDITGQAAVLQRITVPCVFVTCDAGAARLPNVSSVTVDDRRAGAAAVEHLMDNGHKRIAIVGGALENENNIGLRYSGALDAFRRRDVDFDQRLYLTCGFSFESAYAAVRGAIEEGREFTAVFAMSDVMAIGAAKAITDCGLRVPEDVSIVGYDGTSLARFYNPSITSIRQPQLELARIGVELMVHLLEGGIPEHIALVTQLVSGGSVIHI